MHNSVFLVYKTLSEQKKVQRCTANTVAISYVYET